MKHLQDYIFENIVNIFESESIKLRNELRKLISPWFKNNSINRKISDTKQQTPKEIFRYPLGDEISARSLLKEIFDSIKDPNIKIEISNDPPSIVNRSKGGSGTYESFKISYKNETFYVANTTTSKANLKNKELTPAKLGLAEENNKYSSFTDLTDKLQNSLNKIKDNHKDSGIYELLNELIDKIKNSDFKRIGSFKHNNIETFFEDENEGKLSININSDYINNILNGDINCIEKDFGEVLGPLMFFRLFDNVELVYPSASNEALVDYYINGHKISAKQLGGGGKPSGASVAKTALDICKNIEKNPEDITDETSELSKQEKNKLFEKEEISFINDVLSTYNSSIFIQQRDLIIKFVLSQNNDVNEHLKSLNLENINNDKELENKLDNILNNTNIKEYFDKLYGYLGYTSTKSSSWTPEIISKEYSNINSKLKWGILFYPLYKTAINEIVSKYGNQKNDIISSVIQKVTDMKQIYLGIRKKDSSINVEIVSSGVSKWTLTTGGMSTNNINNSKLSIELKH